MRMRPSFVQATPTFGPADVLGSPAQLSGSTPCRRKGIPHITARRASPSLWDPHATATQDSFSARLSAFPLCSPRDDAHADRALTHLARPVHPPPSSAPSCFHSSNATPHSTGEHWLTALIVCVHLACSESASAEALTRDAPPPRSSARSAEPTSLSN